MNDKNENMAFIACSQVIVVFQKSWPLIGINYSDDNMI